MGAVCWTVKMMWTGSVPWRAFLRLSTVTRVQSHNTGSENVRQDIDVRIIRRVLQKIQSDGPLKHLTRSTLCVFIHHGSYVCRFCVMT